MGFNENTISKTIETLRIVSGESVMDTVNKLLEYEKVIIYCPSVLVCSYVLVQLFVLANFFDSDYDNNKPKQSLFEQWYGFWVMAPTFVFNFILVVYISYEKSIRSRNISQRDSDIQKQRLQKMDEMDGGNVFDQVVQEEDDEEDDENKKIIVDSTEITAEEETRVIALNVSLMNKWLWTTPTFFLAACKISWDHEDAYTWKFIFTPLAAYIAYFLWVAYSKKNWLWQDQRDIDIAEKRQLQLDAEARALAIARSKKKASVVVNEHMADV